MGATPTVFCVLLGMVAVTHVFANLWNLHGVRGPEPMSARTIRSVPNRRDCPPSWTHPRPEPMPQRPCPPGTQRHMQVHHYYGIPPLPCPPWVDDNGKCHIADRRFDGNRCRRFYGELTYARWQKNAHLTPPAGPPGPEPMCVPV